MARAFTWTTRCILLPPTIKTTASLQTRPATRVTPTTPCLERSGRNLAGSGISMFTIYEKNQLPRISNCMSLITSGSALHCHLGARSFEQGAVHNADPDTLPAVKTNEVSCISSGCHDVVHNLRQLDKVKFWSGGIDIAYGLDGSSTTTDFGTASDFGLAG